MYNFKLYPALHKLGSCLLIRFLQCIAHVGGWGAVNVATMHFTAAVHPCFLCSCVQVLSSRNLCHIASSHSDGGCQCGQTSRRGYLLVVECRTSFFDSVHFE